MKVRDILKVGSDWMPGRSDNTPMVSVILPTYSRAKSGLFKAAVDSVLRQKYTDLELIIVDDCSVDGSIDITKEMMEKDGRVSCLRHKKNIGLPAISEYEGYRKARGKYIAFIFDDNEWDELALYKTIPLMEKDNLMCTYGIAHLVYNNDLDYLELGDPEITSLDLLIERNIIANGSIVINREVFETVGMYDPHLAITRQCDWDFLQRINNRYGLVGTGVFFTTEHGYILKDSLGNSFKMNRWVARELMQIERNSLLLPDKLEDYDIVDEFGGRTELFNTAVNEYLSQYEGKAWFDPSDDSIAALKNHSAVNPNIKLIAVVAHEFGASITLSFARLFKDGSVVLRFFDSNVFLFCDLLMADAIISVRDPFKNIIDNKCLAKIKKFYYTDDNFKVLYEKTDHDKLRDLDYIANVAKHWNRSFLKKYDGIICSCDNLRDYFLEEGLHDKVYTLENSICSNMIAELNEIDKRVSVAFMGGAFRNKVLKDCVFNALNRLAEDIDITLFYPYDKENTHEHDIAEKFKIVKIKRDTSLDNALATYGRNKINILVHCGEDMANNAYKTKGAITNAAQLGAALVVSKCLPYTIDDNDSGAYLISENTPEAWYTELKRVIFDKSLHEQTFEKAKNVCLTRYLPENAENLLIDLTNDVKRTSLLDCMERAIQFEINRHTLDDSLSIGSYFDRSRRPYDVDEIYFNGNMRGKYRYRVLCDSMAFAAFAAIFSCVGEKPDGTIHMKMYYKNQLLREASVEMSDIENNQWTYFKFFPVSGYGVRYMTIVLDFEYKSESEKIGTFEILANRKLPQKVFETMHMKHKSKNVLLCDFVN